MVAKRRPLPAVSPELLAPVFRPVIEPIVEPVVERLDKLEKAVREVKEGLDVQFKRTAQMQAQLDRLLAEIASLKR